MFDFYTNFIRLKSIRTIEIQFGTHTILVKLTIIKLNRKKYIINNNNNNKNNKKNNKRKHYKTNILKQIN